MATAVWASDLDLVPVADGRVNVGVTEGEREARRRLRYGVVVLPRAEADLDERGQRGHSAAPRADSCRSQRGSRPRHG